LIGPSVEDIFHDCLIFFFNLYVFLLWSIRCWLFLLLRKIDLSISRHSTIYYLSFGFIFGFNFHGGFFIYYLIDLSKILYWCHSTVLNYFYFIIKDYEDQLSKDSSIILTNHHYNYSKIYVIY
jgi:hypothetical protein